MNRSLACAVLVVVAACGSDVEPTGVVDSGTLVARTDLEGWAVPGTVFEATGPSGLVTMVADGEGVARATRVVPGTYAVRVRASDDDARFDAPQVSVLVRPDAADTVVVPGRFEPGRFTQVAVGNAVICALNENGNPYCWGLGEFGELGNGSAGRTVTPLRARAPEPLTDLAAGSLHMCAVGQSGAAFCWGLNASGRLGTGLTGEEARFLTVPTPVAGGLRFSAVTAGQGFSCGLEASTGRAWCWGSAAVGQLGNGERSGATATPLPVDTEARFVHLEVKEQWAGASAVAGRTDDGRVFVWGASPANGRSWLAYSGATPVQVPLPGPARAATSVCAQLAEEVVCWPDLSGNVPDEVLDVLLPTAEAGLRTYSTTPLDEAFFQGGFHCRATSAGYDCSDSWAFPLPLLSFDGEAAVDVASFGRGGCAVTEPGNVWCWTGDFFEASLRAGPGAG